MLSEESKAALDAVIAPIQRRKKSKFLTSTKFTQPAPPKGIPTVTEALGDLPIVGGTIRRGAEAIEKGSQNVQETVRGFMHGNEKQQMDYVNKRLAEKGLTVEDIPEDQREQTIANIAKQMPAGQGLNPGVAAFKIGGDAIGATANAVQAPLEPAAELMVNTVKNYYGNKIREVNIEAGRDPDEAIENIQNYFGEKAAGLAEGWQSFKENNPNIAATAEGSAGYVNAFLTFGIGGKTVKETANITKKTLPELKELATAPIKKGKGLISEATGTASKARSAQVIEETRPTFKGAEAAVEKNIEATARRKATKEGLMSDYKVAEKTTGEKVVPKFTGESTKFAKEGAHKRVVAEFWDNPKAILDKGDLADYAIKISDMSPSGGTSYRAVADLRKYVVENTSKKFAQLSDSYSTAKKALFESATPEAKNAAKAQIDKIGKAMDAEIKNLSGNTVDGQVFRDGLESVLLEQKVPLVRSPITEITKKDLDRILKENPNDPRVQQYLDDLKTESAFKAEKTSRDTVLKLKRKIMDGGTVKEPSVRKMLLEDGISNDFTAEGDLLRSVLPEALVKDIVKSRVITEKNMKAIAIKLAEAYGIGKVVEFASGSDVPFF